MSKSSGKGRIKPPQSTARSRADTKPAPVEQAPIGSVLRLQQAAGNQAVNGLLRGGAGKPLDPVTRRKMEGRFGESFRNVKVHTGGDAAQSAELLGAKAWTSGSNITFAEGSYAPETGTGRELLAHELAHVVQQRRGGTAPQTFDTQSSAEQDASSAAAQAVSSSTGTVAVNATSGVGVAREEAELPWWKKRLNPIYQRALQVLPPETGHRIEQINDAAKQFVEQTGTSNETLNKAVQEAEPVIAPIAAALGVQDSAKSPSAAAGAATPAGHEKADPGTSTSGSPTLAAAGLIPILIPNGGLAGPPVSGGPGPFTPGSPLAPNGTFANLGRGVAGDTAATDVAADTAVNSAADTAATNVAADTAATNAVVDTTIADTAIGTTASDALATSLATRALLLAPRAGVAGIAFAAGFFGPFLIGKAIEHADELQQQADPDEGEHAIAGAPPQVASDSEGGTADPDALDAGAKEVTQAPSAQDHVPAVDPGSTENAILPPNQDQAPAIDPNRTDPAQAPGQSTDELEAAGKDRRPTLRDSTVLQVWSDALKRGKGVVRDKATGEKLEAPYYDKNGKLIYDWHMGHLAEHEWWRLRKLYEAGKLTWPEVVDQYNDPSHYHPEDPAGNMSHEDEDKSEWQLPDGTVIRYGPGRPFRRPVPKGPARRKR